MCKTITVSLFYFIFLRSLLLWGPGGGGGDDEEEEEEDGKVETARHKRHISHMCHDALTVTHTHTHNTQIDSWCTIDEEEEKEKIPEMAPVNLEVSHTRTYLQKMGGREWGKVATHPLS